MEANACGGWNEFLIYEVNGSFSYIEIYECKLNNSEIIKIHFSLFEFTFSLSVLTH